MAYLDFFVVIFRLAIVVNHPKKKEMKTCFFMRLVREENYHKSGPTALSLVTESSADR